MTQIVRLGPMVFNIGSDELGQWVCQDLQGWYSSPSVRGGTDDRPVADGAFGSVKNYRSARPLTFSGYLLSSSVGAASEEMFDTFAALQADGAPFLLSVENENGIRSLTVSMNGVADVQPLQYLRGASVSVPLIAYDPIKYGPSTTKSSNLPTAGGGLEYNLFNGGSGGALFYGALGNLGRLTLTNNGTADVWPSFLISGGLTAGFFVECLETGETIRYDRVVPDGSTVGLDSRTESVTVDGVPGGSTYLTRFEWFSVPAKSSRTVQFNAIGGSSGTPSMSATVADGFW